MKKIMLDTPCLVIDKLTKTFGPTAFAISGEQA